MKSSPLNIPNSAFLNQDLNNLYVKAHVLLNDLNLKNDNYQNYINELDSEVSKNTQFIEKMVNKFKGIIFQKNLYI